MEAHYNIKYDIKYEETIQYIVSYKYRRGGGALIKKQNKLHEFFLAGTVDMKQ